MALLMALFPFVTFAQKAEITSPDETIRVVFTADGERMSYDVIYNGRTVLAGNRLGLTVDGRALPAKVKSQKSVRRHQTVEPVVPIKFSHIEKDYNELTLTMQGGYSLVWRAYNDGIAYRFVTKMKGEINVDDETILLGVRPDYLLHIQEDVKFTSAYENAYVHTTNAEWTATGKMACLPLLVDADGCKILFSEADHYDYPRAFLKHADEGLQGAFSKAWIGEKKVHDRFTAPLDYAPYIAHTQGARKFPWRYMVIAGRDEALVENTMNACLSSDKCEIADTSWIRPGQVSWDWWNGKAVYGPDVNFKCGINTDTYKYYIDFAASHHMPYIVLDEGWYDSNRGDLMHPIDAIRLPELIAYGKQRGVDIVLWTVFNVIDEHLDEACSHYAAMGIKGFKVDFMDRNDQTAFEMVERLAACCARHKLLLDLHGIYTPVGLNRTYPNVLNYESVFGMEEARWTTISDHDMPRYDVTFPYIRMMAGQVDFTPGAMRNASAQDWMPIYRKPMSMGTRCHQAACYVVQDSPFTMLADSPTSYAADEPYTHFIASIPDTWHETRILQGTLGEYIVTARRHGDDWYIGGQTNWTERSIDIDLSTLGISPDSDIQLLSDGVNANHDAEDYRLDTLKAGNLGTLHLASGGGFVIKILKK